MKRRNSYRRYPHNPYPHNPYSQNPYRKKHEQIGILVSLALHAILFAAILTTKAPHPAPASTIEVTIEPALATQKRTQIVSPSEARQQAPLEETTRLSDKDSRAEVEQIRRGDGGGMPGQPQKTAPAAPKPIQKQSAAKRELNLKDLKLDDSTLALKFGTTPKNQATDPEVAANSPTKSLSEYQAFSRPPGSGAAFFGSAGISDHLPNLPDGDITLLNAKANIYASFVRRVAIQVFTQLRSQGWERLSAQQIRQLTGFATVVATLNSAGKFIRAEIVESSGSAEFDSVLHTSATKGASDPNPPPGAQAKDGAIHFIFKARSWSQTGVNRRSGAPFEQRWILLATGLE